MALSLQRYTWSDFDSGINRFLKERSMKGRERSMLITIKKGDCLPENLIIEILSRLPVKDLLQYKTVCKSWCAIISSPQFISQHLQNYYNNNDDWRGCLLVQYYVSHAELQLFELLVDETPRVLAQEVLYAMPMYGSYICGPCDGLYYVYDYGGHRALWNPAINERKVLPPIITKPNPPSNTTYAQNEDFGFGLDPVTRDYKVVVIKGYWSTNDEDVSYPLSILVYSSRTDSWKYCGDLAREYELENNKCYTVVNGCCFWLGSMSEDDEKSGELIISFDMATDTCKEIPVPDYEQPASKSLGIYDKSLAFFSVHEDAKVFDIWTLKEEVWTKKIVMGPFPELRNPLGHWKDNMVLLEFEGSKLVLCDPSTHEVKDLGFRKDLPCQGIYAYMESLVSFKDWSKSEPQEEVEVDNHEV